MFVGILKAQVRLRADSLAWSSWMSVAEASFSDLTTLSGHSSWYSQFRGGIP